ncbi:MarR family winged helix-turn-helix transcriptional regulator [Paenibacillus lutrae]
MNERMNEQQRIHQIFKSYREVNHAFYHVLAKTAQIHGLTRVQLIVLRALTDHPDIGLSELSECIQLGRSTTSGIVERMVKAGLVTRQRLHADRRSLSLNLSEKGAVIWQQVKAEHLVNMTPLLALSEEDQQQLFRINEQIIHILQRVRDDNDHE